MIRLVGAPEGAEAGESRLLVCSGLLRRLGMNNFYRWYRVLVSRVPSQGSHAVPRSPPGEGTRSCIEECLSQLINLSLVAGSGTVSLHGGDTRGKCMAQSCALCFLRQWLYNLQAPGRSHTTRKSSRRSRRPCPSHREQPFLLFASLAANHCGSK